MIGRRGTQIGLVAVMAVAGIGFVVGIDDGVPRADIRYAERAPGTAEGGAGVRPATSYLDLRNQRPGANAGFRTSLEDLAAAAEPPDVPEGDLARRRALAQREERRAFNGAPPVIPHEADPVGSDACLSCHESSVRLADESAGGLPHPYYTNCQQCHVAESPLLEPVVLAASSFEGLAAPDGGDRAWEGAPPTIPHSTWMRGNCLSCHGPNGQVGIRTSHPERVNCLQCHAPSAELDQVDIGPQRFLSSAAGTN
ncbi:MAG: diheme cytochrome c precursor [Gemmatimonadetes bacterium]|nr:diheme cytochrome c precursor [Gemmatimonadota bacterium]